MVRKLKKPIKIILTLAFLILGILSQPKLGLALDNPVPSEINPKVAAGTDHTLAIKADGTLWTWGSNLSGQLGDGTAIYPYYQATPAQVMTEVKSVAAIAFHSFAIKEDGTLWAWGDNMHGVLGDGTTTNRLSPVLIMDDVKRVVVQDFQTFAIKEDGTLWAWGDNTYGELGDGTTTNRLSPVQIMSDVKNIAMGYSETLAIKNDDTLWAWGDNQYGQLGDGSTANKLDPVLVLSGVKSVATGNAHTLAIKENGSLWAWGSNSIGQLGDGTTTNRDIPVQVLSEVRYVTTSSDQTFAIKEDGTLWAWGDNTYGKLGDGTSTNQVSPVQVMNGVTILETGNKCTFAIKDDATLWAWGKNDQGQLGDGTSTDKTTPVQVMDNAKHVVAGTFYHTVAVKEDGTLWAWGYNYFVELSDGAKAPSTTPVQIMRVSTAQVSALPVVKIDLNHKADEIAGMYVGLKNIKDSTGTPLSNPIISGYRIEVDFDPNQVTIPDVLDATTTTSGGLFLKNIQIDNGLGKVLVSSASDSEIPNFDQLFFLPMALKGSVTELTSVSVKYLNVIDNNLHRILIPTLDNLKFQRGKIYNGELGEPNIADAVAGLQYLALLRNPGRGLEDVNLVNMASISETGDMNVAKANVKDIIALMQYTVNLRNDHFRPVNSDVNFGYRIVDSTGSGIRLEFDEQDLENGDLVQVLKGSDNTNVIDPMTVQLSNGNPLVLDNINYGGELYLKVRITRGNNVGERLLFNKMHVKMTGIEATNTTNTTDIVVLGLQPGDIVSLYKDSNQQIGTQSVGANSTGVKFSDVSIVDNGIKVQISRPTPASSTPSMFYKWGNLISLEWRTESTENGLETLTMQYLESGDVVNLYDSAGNALAGKQGLPAGTNGEVTINDLELKTYQVEVVRGTIHSDLRKVAPPQQHVNFGAGISNDEMGVKQLRLFDLKSGDQVEILKGSDNTNYMAPFTVGEADPNPWVIDNINLVDELYLKVRVTRNGLVDEQNVFDDLFISLGAIAEDNTTSITIYGLKSGDRISLYQGSGSQIGSTQIGDTSIPTVFTNVPILEEEGYKFEISRTNPLSSTGMTYGRPKDFIVTWWRTDIAENGLETLTMQYLESGDVVNLYDSAGNALAGKQGLPAGTNGEVTINDLELKTYQVEVVRGTIHSDLRKVDPPQLHVNFGAGTSNDEMGGRRLELYDLKSGDQVEILKGSDNSNDIDPFTVPAASPNPWVIDNIDFGNELFLKIRVTRNGFVGERYVYNSLSILMGAIAEDNTTSISLNGLQTGDQVRLYRGDGSQIGSTQSVVDSLQPLVFNNISLTGEQGVQFKISRTGAAGSYTGEDYRRWQDMIAVWWRADITGNGLENLTLQNLENGDIVNLYDSNGNTLTGQPSQSPNSEGKVTFSDLELKDYQVEVVRGNIHSSLRKVSAAQAQ